MPQSIRFAKLSATGNDFILVDNRHRLFRGDEQELFHRLCRRRVAIGADGILLIEHSKQRLAHFTMRYFNRDGRESEMCGNGARACAYYAVHHGLAPAEMRFEVSGDLYEAAVSGSNVRLRMQKPRDLRLLPGIVEEKNMAEGGFVNTGVPHYVLFVAAVESVEVATIGLAYRRHPAFQPAGTNVNFVATAGPSKIQMRTYERGVEEETLACGTGAVAAAIFAHLQQGMPFPIDVITRGGDLRVYGDPTLAQLQLEGRVRLVYQGYFRLEDFSEDF
ncbi:MAG: diaminopimelate epimerase [candidate division KSB1 bacterium]|nr:diaminopimelate epimerase [candidate division KSB1 bacterium]